ncbi:MAG TPA: glycosyltransferase [Longimicrobiales bacterium]|nr:glycosyltransferase [Longimicrobiales bacterium]
MSAAAAVLVATIVLLGAYTYAGYPLLLVLLRRVRRRRPAYAAPAEWPPISITIPVHDEQDRIAATLESILRVEYPADRRQILVVSDASTDRTEEIVRGFADRGVELLALQERRGKTAAENTARPYLRGEIVVNTDASVHIRPDAVERLVERFADPTVGVASGRDVSIARAGAENPGESRYVGYEMWVRGLESDVSGIVGASGCLYAIRAELHRSVALPEALSRDFAAALVARLHGFRAVSVDAAICAVPRTGSLRSEYRRKVRTMTRGMQTLGYFARLMNPLRYGIFGLFLVSHKLCRWLTAWCGVPLLAALAILAVDEPLARWAIAAALATIAAGAVGLAAPALRHRVPVLGLAAYLLAGNLAALHALARTLRGGADPVWEPTRRAVAADG